MKQSRRGFTIQINHVSRGNLTSSRQAPYILVNGKEDSAMDLENRLGPTARNMLVNGEKTEHMEREDSSTLTETSITVIGQTIRRMAAEFINT